MAKNKNKNKGQDKEVEKIILSVFVLSLLGLGGYYINERIKLAKQKKENEQQAISNTGGTNTNVGGSTNTGGTNTNVGGGTNTGNTNSNVGPYAICNGAKNEKVAILQDWIVDYASPQFPTYKFLPKYGKDKEWGKETQDAVDVIFGKSKRCFTQAELDKMKKDMCPFWNPFC